jgi:hypothetical protein
VQNPSPESLDREPEREEIHGGGAYDAGPDPDIKAGDTEKDGSKAPVTVGASTVAKDR